MEKVWQAVLSALTVGGLAAIGALIASLAQVVDVTTVEGLILAGIVAGLKWVQKILTLRKV